MASLSISNYQQALHWFEETGTFTVRENTFYRPSFADRIRHFLSKEFHQEQTEAATAIFTKIFEEQPGSQEDCLSLADRLIQRYPTDPHFKDLDFRLAPYRKQLTYFAKENREAFAYWQKSDQPIEIFCHHPRFAKFLKDSKILSQMRITKDQIKWIEQTPYLLVNGELLHEEAVCNQFEIVESRDYASTFVFHKIDRQVYTYLDNGKGLQPHHPYKTPLTPISKLTNEEYERTHQLASRFIRPGEEHIPENQRNQNRNFILQIVTFVVDGPDTNFHNLVANPIHSYVRLINGTDHERLGEKGQVRGVGYYEGKKPWKYSLMSTIGRFRGPDPWEYKPKEKTTVTNILISQEEAESVFQFLHEHHQDTEQLGRNSQFHILRQNCTVFIQGACQKAGIEIPTEVQLPQLIKKISPVWAQNAGRILAHAKAAVERRMQAVGRILLPREARVYFAAMGQKINQIWQAALSSIVAFFLTPLRFLLGDGLGDDGVVFHREGPEAVDPGRPLSSWRYFFDLSSHRFNLPGILLDWQNKQPSTVTYDRPNKLSIAAPLEEQVAHA